MAAVPAPACWPRTDLWRPSFRRRWSTRCLACWWPGCWCATDFPRQENRRRLVDLPLFALPTAVAGISLTALLASNGWIGSAGAPRHPARVHAPGVVIALIFIGLPFVVRTVQPVLEDARKELEEAATSLGATALADLPPSILPIHRPPLLTGFAMAFARGMANTARSSSSPATCPWSRRSRRSSSSASWSSTTTPATAMATVMLCSSISSCCWSSTCCCKRRAGSAPSARMGCRHDCQPATFNRNAVRAPGRHRARPGSNGRSSAGAGLSCSCSWPCRWRPCSPRPAQGWDVFSKP